MDFSHQKWLERAHSDTGRILAGPLVSIICFCKDRKETIERCIQSVLAQTYGNFEFVVQDGASTDGTLEILRKYQERDPRIKIVSEPDSGPAQGFWRVLNRCEGDIIGTCLSDEELLPDSVERAIGHFRAAPHLGAITCDGFITNPEGKVINEFNAGDFNLVDYLFGWYCPFWPGSFFRRQALLEVGLKTHKWTIECLEFEIWCRLGTRHEVKYVPERMSKYCVHPTQLSNTKQFFHEHFDNRAVLIRRMFSKDGFFGENDVLLNGCLYNQLYLLYNHVRAYKLQEQEELLAARMKALREQIPPIEQFRYLEYFEFVRDAIAKVEQPAAQNVFRKTSMVWTSVRLVTPGAVRNRLPASVKRAMRSLLTKGMFFAFNTRHMIRLLRRAAQVKAEPVAAVLPRPDFSPRVYAEVAKVYYARGQIDEALRLWRKAEALKDPVIDGVACQAMLMSPTATYEGLLEAQTRWAKNHAKSPLASGHTWPKAENGRRIRVGYHCAFMNSDLMRFMLLQSIARRDRDRFEVFGYSPFPTPRDVAGHFDGFRVTGDKADEEFVNLVRQDQVDIFVEVSGFSPGHRFSAMAMRCAPVQISYLNHTGTSAVPNVDYVLADDTSVKPEEQRYFTEKVFSLPGSFLCYNYDAAPHPEVAEVPSAKKGFVTFCCFGSGGKINLRTIELWSEILRRVPGSQFFIRNAQLDSPDNIAYLQSCFARYGIGPERLRLLGGTDRNSLLKCYDEVDISLDTWPYCGGNTIAEPLWQGVPVVTLKGERFSGRYGAGLLLVAGCPELVADTADRYVEIAAELAGSPERLATYRKNLRTMARAKGLSDAEKFARKLEAAYVEILQRGAVGAA